MAEQFNEELCFAMGKVEFQELKHLRKKHGTAHHIKLDIVFQ